jgi:hypothetical protein
MDGEKLHIAEIQQCNGQLPFVVFSKPAKNTD